MSTVKTYTYDGVSYAAEEEVRQAIWEKERKVFCVAPEENTAEFWEARGVEYSETVEEASLDDLKAAKLLKLSASFFAWRNSSATMISSLGFTADADSRAMQDITGLWIRATQDSDYTTTFMDAENVAHTVGAEDILTLASEVTRAGEDAYARKWELRAQIEAAEDVFALDAIEISFEAPDYTES